MMLSTIRNLDIGFFEPVKNVKGPGVNSDGKMTKYSNAHAFTDRLKYIATTHSPDLVKSFWALMAGAMD